MMEVLRNHGTILGFFLFAYAAIYHPSWFSVRFNINIVINVMITICRAPGTSFRSFFIWASVYHDSWQFAFQVMWKNSNIQPFQCHVESRLGFNRIRNEIFGISVVCWCIRDINSFRLSAQHWPLLIAEPRIYVFIILYKNISAKQEKNYIYDRLETLKLIRLESPKGFSSFLFPSFCAVRLCSTKTTGYWMEWKKTLSERKLEARKI